MTNFSETPIEPINHDDVLVGDDIDLFVGGAPIIRILGTDNFPCLSPDDGDRYDAAQAEVADLADYVRCAVNAHADLLAALEAQSATAAHFGQCHQCGADLRGNVWHCFEYGRLLVKARDMARDAIAKAKGGA